MFDRNYINRSVDWLGVTNFLGNDGLPWTLNLLDPYDNWGGRGSSTSPNLGSGSRGYSNGFSLNCNSTARILLINHRRIFDNTRSAVHNSCDDILTENRMYLMQSPSTCRNLIRVCLVNRQDNGLDDCWDLSVRQ